jgi:hypothetical protein
VKKALRLFALAYSMAAGVLAFLKQLDVMSSAFPWIAVCLSAMTLAIVAIVWKPLTLLCAAHAGLTATWAGTLAPSVRFSDRPDALVTVVSLLGLCAGMAVLIAFGLRLGRLAAAQTSQPR